MAKTLLYDLEFDALSQALTELGQPPFRAKQIWSGMYQQLYENFAQFSSISTALRSSLTERFLLTPISPRSTLRSKDGLTEKILFGLPDQLSVKLF